MLPPRRFVPPKITPPGKITSAEQLMAIAHGLEHEAGRRYRELAERMRLQGEEVLADLFASLANIEDKHAADVDARVMVLLGHPAKPAAVGWDLPENFDEEDARSAGLSPYRALAAADTNEDRAFAFYSYIAAYAATTELRRAAEQFAMDELAHASLLRQERRKARRAQAASHAPPDPQPETVEMLLAEAVPMERATGAAHRALAAHLRATQSPEAADLFDSAADDEEDLARTLAARLPPEAVRPERALGAMSVRDGLKLLESGFERYAQIVDQAAVEDVLLEGQKLAERALRRLAYVYGALEEALVT